jgi:hypothetical protein
MTEEQELRVKIKRVVDDLLDCIESDVPYPPDALGTDAGLWTNGELADYLRRVSEAVGMRLVT